MDFIWSCISLSRKARGVLGPEELRDTDLEGVANMITGENALCDMCHTPGCTKGAQSHANCSYLPYGPSVGNGVLGNFCSYLVVTIHYSLILQVMSSETSSGGLKPCVTQTLHLLCFFFSYISS